MMSIGLTGRDTSIKGSHYAIRRCYQILGCDKLYSFSLFCFVILMSLCEIRGWAEYDTPFYALGGVEMLLDNRTGSVVRSVRRGG